MTVRPEDLQKKQEVFVVERERKPRMIRYAQIQLKSESNGDAKQTQQSSFKGKWKPVPATRRGEPLKASIAEQRQQREREREPADADLPGEVLYDGERGQWGVIRQLGPEEARHMLARLHPDQRKPSSKHVDTIVRAMTRGEYKWTGDPIRFDPDGQLLDGQHRLLAVTISEVTLTDVPFAVLAEDDVMRFIDTVSKPRTVQQIMKTEGFGSVPNAVLAAVVYCENSFHDVNLSRAEKVEVVRESDLLKPALTLFNTRATGMPVTTGPLAGALECWRHAGEDAMDFFQAAFKNQHMVHGTYSPNAALLATWLLQARTDRSHRISPREGAEKSIRAWNAHRDGRTLTKLQSGRSRQMPEARE